MARSILEMRERAAARSGTGGAAAARSRRRGRHAAERDGRRDQAAAAERDGTVPGAAAARAAESFVELNAYDNFGKTNYGTAGYLGDGYFITVKHGVIALDETARAAMRGGSRRSRSATRARTSRPRRRLGRRQRRGASGRLGDHQRQQPLDLPPLRIDTSYAYEFAEPIFRLGNDYSKGIILSTGYVGQRTANGLVTCLTDGHPGVSGGGVLNQEGDLVGIPIGRMQGDYRFSFILPLRAEMFRKVPHRHGGQWKAGHC